LIQRRGSSRFSTEAFEGRRIFGQFIGKKLQRDVAAEIRVLSFVHHAHATNAKLFSDAVVGDGVANQRIGARHVPTYWVGPESKSTPPEC
jgi:hypothetical protein